jgi:hypothetical protein
VTGNVQGSNIHLSQAYGFVGAMPLKWGIARAESYSNQQQEWKTKDMFLNLVHTSNKIYHGYNLAQTYRMPVRCVFTEQDFVDYTRKIVKISQA